MYNLKFCLFFVLSIFCTDIFALDWDHSFEISGGMAPVSLDDRNFSTVVYAGAPLRLGAGYGVESPLFSNVIAIAYSAGSITPVTGGNSVLTATDYQHLSFDWYHLRKIGISEEKGLFLSLGADLKTSYTGYRRTAVSGAEEHYRYESILGPILHLSGNMLIGDRVCSGEVFLGGALAAYAIYPAYGSQFPSSEYGSEIETRSGIDSLASGTLLFPDKFQQGHFGINFLFPLNESLLVKTGYHWELMHHKRETDYYRAEHSITVSFVFGKVL